MTTTNKRISKQEDKFSKAFRDCTFSQDQETYHKDSTLDFQQEYTKRPYISQSVSKRVTLVKMVVEEGKPIKDAALELGINYSTAKHIVKHYKETGHVETK